ncbi:hypothetical protein M3Y99_01474100 [Aphelenchoides fujianensis]|nr:hypothetical protein M3Y99_01474100 [Aphelenchoides fujianensis]
MKFASVVLFAALMGVSVQAATLRVRRTPPAEVAAPIAAQAAEREAQILEQAKKVEERVKDETQATLEAAKHGGPTINRPGIAIASPAAPAPALAVGDAQPNVELNRPVRQSGDLAHDVADAQARDRTNTNVGLSNVRAQADAERIRIHTDTNNQLVAQQNADRDALLRAQALEREQHPEDPNLPARQAQKLDEFNRQQAELNRALVDAQVVERTKANEAAADASARLDRANIARDTAVHDQVANIQAAANAQGAPVVGVVTV